MEKFIELFYSENSKKTFTADIRQTGNMGRGIKKENFLKPAKKLAEKQLFT